MKKPSNTAVNAELQAIFAEQGKDYVVTAETHPALLRAVADQILAELDTADEDACIDGSGTIFHHQPGKSKPPVV